MVVSSEGCNSLGLKQILHSPPFEKGIIERAMEYVKDRTEGFDYYYPCRKSVVDCDVIHVYQWLILFIFLYIIYQNNNLK
jgi:putative transposase